VFQNATIDMIASNIRFLRNARNLSQEALALQLEITRARLVSYESGRTEPSIEMLLKLSSHFDISIDALLKGDLSKTNPEALMKVGKNRILFPVILNAEGIDLVEIIPEKAIAGYLKGYSDPEYIEGLQRMNLPFLPTGKHRAFPIKGDSMPPIKEGAFVVGKFVEDLSEVKNGYTYIVLSRNDGIVYKRVYDKLASDSSLELHSDNKLYAPYLLHANDILELWEYTCTINTGKYKEEELNLNSIMNMMREMKIELQRLQTSVKS